MFFSVSLTAPAYAPRLVKTEDGLFELAFLGTSAEGTFIGALSDPLPVTVGADGLLSIAKQ